MLSLKREQKTHSTDDEKLFVGCVFFCLQLSFGWRCDMRQRFERIEKMTLTQDQLEAWIIQLIKDNQLEKFYKWHEWRELSEQIKKENNYECQLCKKRGFHTPARSVHHVQWVRKHPRLAMSRTYTYNGKEYQNLIPLCESCHNEQHPDKRVAREHKKEKFINEERW